MILFQKIILLKVLATVDYLFSFIEPIYNFVFLSMKKLNLLQINSFDNKYSDNKEK